MLTYVSATNNLAVESNFTFDGTSNVGTLSGQLKASEIALNSQGASSTGDVGVGARVYVELASDAVTAGRVYVYTSSGWSLADVTSATQQNYAGLLGVTMGTALNDNLCLYGIVNIGYDAGGSTGDVVYLSDAQAGRVTTTVPGTGDVVRIAGYKFSTTQIFFNPSPDWIVRT